MSYGARGPPAGYSAPRDVATAAPRRCQKCNASTHYTSECTVDPKTLYVQRPSRTAMLKRGLKRKPVAASAPLSEGHAFEAELKERAGLLEQELRAEMGLAEQTTTLPDNDNHENEVEAEKRARSEASEPADTRQRGPKPERDDELSDLSSEAAEDAGDRAEWKANKL